MNDLIDRRTLIKDLIADCLKAKEESLNKQMNISDIYCRIESLVYKQKQIEAKPVEWIPVTELDLDHNQEALIKLDDGFICSAKFLISDSGNNCGFYHKHIGFLQCPQVVAWMPYNAERGGKNE